MADDHRHDGITAAAAAIHGIERGEDVRRRRARRADALQLGREHVEQHFGIGAGVEVAPVFAGQHFGELGGVGEVAVVRRGRCRTANSRRTAALRRRRRSPRWDSARGRCRRCPSGAACGAAGRRRAPGRLLAHEQLAFVAGHDAGGILAAVLQHRQRVVEPLIDRDCPTIPTIPHILSSSRPRRLHVDDGSHARFREVLDPARQLAGVRQQVRAFPPFDLG